MNHSLVWTASSLLMLVLGTAPAVTAADPAAGRGGGLVPGTAGPASRATREELLREWDLDGDGSVNKSEADIARARMRRKRMELQLGSGIDPLTGLPRAPEGSEAAADESAEEPQFQLPPESPPTEPPRAKPAGPPGIPVPGVQSPAAGQQPPRPDTTTMPGIQPDATRPPTSLSSRASWLPPQRLAPAVTGGVRAGAPAATTGYGSRAWSDLNAGRRPMSPQPSGEAAGGGAASGTGGLLPGVRQSGRTGAMMLPGSPGRPPATPVPGLPPPPSTGGSRSARVMADEIGADQP